MVEFKRGVNGLVFTSVVGTVNGEVKRWRKQTILSRSKPPRYKRSNVLNKPVVAVRIIGLGVPPCSPFRRQFSRAKFEGKVTTSLSVWYSREWSWQLVRRRRFNKDRCNIKGANYPQRETATLAVAFVRCCTTWQYLLFSWTPCLLKQACSGKV